MEKTAGFEEIEQMAKNGTYLDLDYRPLAYHSRLTAAPLLLVLALF